MSQLRPPPKPERLIPERVVRKAMEEIIPKYLAKAQQLIGEPLMGGGVAPSELELWRVALFLLAADTKAGENARGRPRLTTNERQAQDVFTLVRIAHYVNERNLTQVELFKHLRQGWVIGVDIKKTQFNEMRTRNKALWKSLCRSPVFVRWLNDEYLA